MYITRFSVKNIKCFDSAELTFPDKPGEQAGWHVLLGVNGTGKSTLLQAMALAMLGPVSGGRLLPQPATWVRAGSKFGVIEASLLAGGEDAVAGGAPRKRPYEARLVVTGKQPVSIEGTHYELPQVSLGDQKQAKSLNTGPYSNRKGWFSAGYGPFRRLSGSGAEDDLSILYSQGREARHLTLFKESAALTRCEKWLSQLHSQAIDKKALGSLADIAEHYLEDTRWVIDSLLPNGVRVADVTSVGVTFETRTGVRVALSQLSDGFRSFLALVIDLLRHIQEANADTDTFKVDRDVPLKISAPGVVLIDEADAHLHPSWQREIGFSLARTFPETQFIVSTHSPFVAQAAKEDGLYIIESNDDGDVTVERSEDWVRGWRADQILLSRHFGLVSTRDPDTERLIQERARLRAGEPTKETLTALKKIERSLDARLTAPGDTLEERDRAERMQAFIDRRLADFEDEADT